jgi:hypothetical protein
LQQVVFPPWQHQDPSPQSVNATFCVGSPFSCPQSESVSNQRYCKVILVLDVFWSAYRVSSTQIREAIRALPCRIGAAPSPEQGLTHIIVQTQPVGVADVWCDFTTCPVRSTAHRNGAHNLIAWLKGGVGDGCAVGVVACCMNGRRVNKYYSEKEIEDLNCLHDENRTSSAGSETEEKEREEGLSEGILSVDEDCRSMKVPFPMLQLLRRLLRLGKPCPLPRLF